MDLNNSKFTLYGLVIGMTIGVIITKELRPELFTKVPILQCAVTNKIKDTIESKKKEKRKRGTFEDTAATSFTTQNTTATGAADGKTGGKFRTKMEGNISHYSL